MAKNFVGQGCKECDLIWPHDWDYWGNPMYSKKCPICSTALIPLADVVPMTARESRKALRHNAFEEHYIAHDLDQMSLEIEALEKGTDEIPAYSPFP